MGEETEAQRGTTSWSPSCSLAGSRIGSQQGVDREFTAQANDHRVVPACAEGESDVVSRLSRTECCNGWAMSALGTEVVNGRMCPILCLPSSQVLPSLGSQAPAEVTVPVSRAENSRI